MFLRQPPRSLKILGAPLEIEWESGPECSEERMSALVKLKVAVNDCDNLPENQVAAYIDRQAKLKADATCRAEGCNGGALLLTVTREVDDCDDGGALLLNRKGFVGRANGTWTVHDRWFSRVFHWISD